jgi:hypothetical protein
MIDEPTALAIASRRATERGWAFGSPLSVKYRNGRYEIETNPGMLGTKTRFTIDAETGEILKEGYIPR